MCSHLHNGQVYVDTYFNFPRPPLRKGEVETQAGNLNK